MFLVKSILILLAFNIGLSAYSSCTTGFACSINDLKAQEQKQELEYISKLNEYFDITLNENVFFNQHLQTVTYRDLFTFNKVL
jgi:hypothetical protein